MAEARATRTTQTRSRIKAALVELIEEKGFESLTVSDITRRAHINRGTFYLHFTDKFDLLGQLEDELILGLEDALLKGELPGTANALDLFPYEKLLAALQLASSDFSFVRAISGRGGDPDFTSKLKRVIEDLLAQGLERTEMVLRDDAKLPLAYSQELAISHVLSIINLWLERGGTESPEQVARMIVEAKDICPISLLVAQNGS